MGNLTLIGVIAASCLVGTLVGWYLNSSLGRRAVRRARVEAEEIVHQAQQNAEHRQQEARLAAREQMRRARRRADREFRDKKTRVNRARASLTVAEQEVEARQGELASREKKLDRRLTEAAAREAKVEADESRLADLIETEKARLEQITSISRDEALNLFLERVRKEARHQATRIVRDARDEAHQIAEAESQKIMALAVERSASDFSTNRTVSAVPLPDEKLKGRLIGHEGKNIKAFEAATGMQLIVDDTPNQVLISGFHPIKREVARLALEKLLKDGNIHPRRIEETVRKMRRKNGAVMRRAAEDALKELRIRKVHPEMVNLLGRLRFRTSYGQNVLEHSKEVAYLSGIMATELGMDEILARRAGLFHDIGKAIDYEREGTHPEIGEEVARKYKEPPIVINAIASHHEDCEPISPISILVAASDALSGARPGARRKTLADYIRRVEAVASSARALDGVSSA
ncbi:MAG: ribonuclease Y, partial [Acidobacteriota bacterium]